jgi:thymidylate synthase
LWIYQDASNSLSLLEEKYGIFWWRDWEVKVDYDEWESFLETTGEVLPSNGTIGQRYGATVRRYDMMNRLLKGLKEDPFGRRHIMNLLQESDLRETDGLYPCAFQTMFTVRKVAGDYYLDMTLTQRSSDFLVASHINKCQYVALQMMVAHEVGMKVGKFGHFVQNLHIYSRHIEQAHELLMRPIAEDTPKLILNAEGKSFYDITVDDFELIGYSPTKPQLKFELGI